MHCPGVFSGPEMAQGHGQNLVINFNTEKMLFSANAKEVVVGAEKLRVTGRSLPTALHLSLFQLPLFRKSHYCVQSVY